MNAPLRSITTGVLAIAIAGAGFPNVLVAQAANTPPVITSVVLTPDVAAENDTVTLNFAFDDPDADRHAVTITWGDNRTPTAFTLVNGERSSFATHQYFDDGATNTPVDRLPVTVAIEDLVNPIVRATATLTLSNVAPIVTAFSVTPTAILDHQTATATGSWMDPSRLDTYTVELDWGDGTPITLSRYGTQVRDFSFAHVYIVGGSHTLTVTVTDDDTGVGSSTATIVVTSPNTPPSDLVVIVDSAVEGGTTPLTATFVDPDAGDTHTATIDWGDGTAPQSLSLAAGVSTFSPTHVYQDSGSYNATVKVADGLASTPVVTVVVSVGNVGPTVTALNLSATSILEQESVTASLTFTDPGVSDTFTITVAWGDGSSWSADYPAGTASASASHQYVAAGHFDVTATVTDSDNASGSMTTPLDVRALNRAPTGLVLRANSPANGAPATLTGSFTDLDVSDTHTVTVAWGDGSTGTLALGPGAASFSTTHTYSSPGTYHVTATVTDPAGLSTAAAVDLVIAKKSSSKTCDLLTVLEQRLLQSPWADDPRARALLERLIAFLSARYGCG